GRRVAKCCLNELALEDSDYNAYSSHPIEGPQGSAAAVSRAVSCARGSSERLWVCLANVLSRGGSSRPRGCKGGTEVQIRSERNRESLSGRHKLPTSRDTIQNTLHGICQRCGWLLTGTHAVREARGLDSASSVSIIGEVMVLTSTPERPKGDCTG
ncbi:unnamed protein product, partial [Ectocarpus sp. 8 AP-2014]